jgi:hypothetical protein
MMDTLEFLIISTLGLFAGIGLVAAIGIGLMLTGLSMLADCAFGP